MHLQGHTHTLTHPHTCWLSPTEPQPPYSVPVEQACQCRWCRSIVNNRMDTLASYRQKQLRMYLETHFPVHWTPSYCSTIDRPEKKQTASCYSKSNWELTNCFFSASLCTTMALFLYSLYKDTLTDWSSMWECARVGLGWLCSRWGTYDLCQSKQQTRLEQCGKHGQGPLFDTDKSFHSVYKCFQVKSLGLVHVVYKH